MAKRIEKSRVGRKAKLPQDKAIPVAHYEISAEVEEFGGIDFAREFAKKNFQEHLAKIRAGRVKKGQYK